MDFSPLAGTGHGDFLDLSEKPRLMDNKRELALSFFRQSAWMGIATVIGGLFMALVHPVVTGFESKEVYGEYVNLLKVWEILVIPTVGLQAVFSQFATSSAAMGHRAVLAGAVRGALTINVVVWAIFAALALIFRTQVEAYFKIPGTQALLISILVPLVFSSLSIFNGILQGEQDFLWMGNIAILGGVARSAMVALLVVACWKKPVGATALPSSLGVFLAYMVTLGFAVWRTRSIWREKAAPFEWRPFLKRIVFLTIGLGTSAWLFNLDVPTIKRFYSETDSGIYAASAVVAGVLIRLTAPFIVVMFPKVAQSAILGKKSNELVLTVALTALAGGALVVVLFIPGVPDLFVRLMQGKSYEAAAKLAPLYCVCLVPLMMSNVLLYSLLARERYAAVPVLALITVGYAVALQHFHDSMREVILVMGLAGVVLFLTTAFFTWVRPGADATADRVPSQQ
jgi:O-antigen/teichoic acid export membrane protein